MRRRPALDSARARADRPRPIRRRFADADAAGALAGPPIGDVGLPGGLSGRETAEAARPGPPDRKIPVITGCAGTATFGTRGLEPGLRVIAGPVPARTLAARVRATMAGRD
ncbi:hypothetical protein ACLBXO_18200 [Methylobacterium sp. C33D]